MDPHRLTQVGRALRELGIPMIPAYSPQARGRSERNFGTWQGRLPQELRLHGIHSVERANQVRSNQLGVGQSHQSLLRSIQDIDSEETQDLQVGGFVDE